MIIIPNVAINGGIPPKAVSPPLIKPNPAPIKIETANASNAAETVSPPVTTEAETTAVSATTEPDDKSIPVVIMINVTPIAIIPNMETCSIILHTVLAEKKPSIETDNPKKRRIKINTIPYALIIFFNVTFSIVNLSFFN